MTNVMDSTVNAGPPARYPNAFERHAQTALALLLVSLLLWVGKTTEETAVAVAEMRIEMVYMKQRSDTPMQFHKNMTDMIIDLQQRIRGLEEKDDG